MKTCSHCKKTKELKDFGTRNRKTKNGIVPQYLSYCKICNSERSREHYYKSKESNVKFIYRFLDVDGNILYVGKTESLANRLSNHFSKTGHLPKKCYEETTLIQYMAMYSTILMDIKEIYYINLYKPRYNNNYIANEPAIIMKEFTNDIWFNYHKEIVDKIKKDTLLDDFILSNARINTIFIRKRNDKFFVYIELNEYNKKRQISKGSFQKLKDAENLRDELKIRYGKS